MSMVDVIGSVAVKALVLTASTDIVAPATLNAVAKSKSNPVAVNVDEIFVVTVPVAIAKVFAVIPAFIAMDDVPGLKATAETVILLDAIASVVARSKSCETTPPST